MPSVAVNMLDVFGWPGSQTIEPFTANLTIGSMSGITTSPLVLLSDEMEILAVWQVVRSHLTARLSSPIGMIPDAYETPDNEGATCHS